MEWIVGIILKIIIEKFTAFSFKIFKIMMLKKGIRIKAEKNVEAIEAGDAHLDQGNLQGWLDELNNET